MDSSPKHSSHAVTPMLCFFVLLIQMLCPVTSTSKMIWIEKHLSSHDPIPFLPLIFLPFLEYFNLYFFSDTWYRTVFNFHRSKPEGRLVSHLYKLQWKIVDVITEASSLLEKQFKSTIVRCPMPHINVKNISFSHKVQLVELTEHHDNTGSIFLLWIFHWCG